jgi:hypothetical protein
MAASDERDSDGMSPQWSGCRGSRIGGEYTTTRNGEVKMFLKSVRPHIGVVQCARGRRKRKSVCYTAAARNDATDLGRSRNDPTLPVVQQAQQHERKRADSFNGGVVSFNGGWEGYTCVPHLE